MYPKNEDLLLFLHQCTSAMHRPWVYSVLSSVYTGFKRACSKSYAYFWDICNLSNFSLFGLERGHGFLQLSVAKLGEFYTFKTYKDIINHPRTKNKQINFSKDFPHHWFCFSFLCDQLL